MDVAIKAALVLLIAMIVIPAVPLYIAARLAYRADCARISGADVTKRRYAWSAGAVTAATLVYGIFGAIPVTTWLASKIILVQPPHEQRNFQMAFDDKTTISVLAMPIDLSPANDGRPIDLSARVWRRRVGGRCALDVRNFDVKPVTIGLEVSRDAAVSNTLPVGVRPDPKTCSIGWNWSALPVVGVDDYRVFFAVKETAPGKPPVEVVLPIAIHVARAASLAETFRFCGQILPTIIAGLISLYFAKRKAVDAKAKIHVVRDLSDDSRRRSS
jgi:hypothetical protein